MSSPSFDANLGISSPCKGRVIAMLLLGVPAPLVGQSVPQRFEYAPELEMVRVDERGRLRVLAVDAKTGLALGPSILKAHPEAGVPTWISVREMDPSTDQLFQHHLRDRSILKPEQHDERIRDDLGFATDVDKERKALVLSRVHHLQRQASRFEVSNVIGLIQGDECYLGQMEMRWGQGGCVVHAKRTQQRAGLLLENGFPSLVTAELVQTATASGADVAKMVRIVLVFPRTRDRRARIRVHLVGDLRRQSGGRTQTRRVHVIAEFTAGGRIELWTSAGENYPYLSWEDAVAYKHEPEWQNAGAGRHVGAHKWERPFHPFSPCDHGVRPIPMIALLALPEAWNAGGYSGAALAGKRIKSKNGTWSLSPRDFVVSGGVWQFDKKGELVVSSPLGTMHGKRVYAWFKAQFAAAKGDPEALASLRDCLEVVVNWASDLPQLPGAGPGKSPPSVSKFLSAK